MTKQLILILSCWRRLKIERHVKIRAEATPYDSAYLPYFAKRKKRPSKWMEEWRLI